MHDSGLDPGWRDDFSAEDTTGATGEILVWFCVINITLSMLNFLNLITELRSYTGMYERMSLLSGKYMPVFRGLRGCDLCNQFSDVSGKMERESKCGYDRSFKNVNQTKTSF